VLGAQLDLFNDRHLRLEEARRALAEGRTQDACRELFRLRDCYPEDPGIAAELDLARTLMRRLGEIEALAPGERPGPLAELARATMGGLRAALLRRAAVELRQAKARRPCSTTRPPASSCSRPGTYTPPGRPPSRRFVTAGARGSSRTSRTSSIGSITRPAPSRAIARRSPSIPMTSTGTSSLMTT